ncbi:hypothetical protein F0562_000867 [Nyssa sinensis]|uniref:Dephospho-CoA kinase n=1 Tax=Nyssa sinensis TaxID=561372 RepID=A0A5J5C1B8_9ASTE|nr:hypothetical protein F0562_000867 [Nyssa sinensis]
MRIVGLTGGIASGKSTVSNLFKAHGIPVVDADLVARDVLKKGTGGWRKVVAAFGDDILLDNGEVDRPKLGQIVFADPLKRQLLNRLLAPYISSGIFCKVLKLWMKGRLMARDMTSVEDAKNRIDAQMPLDLKKNKADIVIDNTGSLDDLEEGFRKVLAQVTKPLTWSEFGLSRQGAILAFISVVVGVLICRKTLW